MSHFISREVRVFISSTFLDMQAEREVLIKQVFPRLRQTRFEQGNVTYEELAQSVLFYQREPTYLDTLPTSMRDKFIGTGEL